MSDQERTQFTLIDQEPADPSTRTHATNRVRILDNQTTGAVADYLRERLPDTDMLRVVSAYFTIYGYGLLADELDSVGRTRFLFGEPTSVTALDPNRNDPMAFDLQDGALTPNQTLQKKALAKRCERWLRRRDVSVRSVRRSNFLHGKMYLAGRDAGVVGSSNFTKGGLGGGAKPNLEINITVEDRDEIEELRQWFDRLWTDDGRTLNVKPEVLKALNRLTDNYAPEFIYYKTLYELFREDIEARGASDERLGDTHLYDSQVWNALYEFQKDGAKSVIAKLRQHNGCILADSVGLGKTYTALAVVKHYETRNERVLVLCPRRLRDNWSVYQAHTANTNNPFPEDRFGYALLSHTDLSRDTGRVGDIDLANFNWSGFDLVVIDESHNFRNTGGARYERLMEEVIKRGASTKVLMLSATPVNTSLIDLRAQVGLMTEENPRHFSRSLDIGNTDSLFSAAQKQFKAWESEQSDSIERDKTALLERLGPDLFHLLGGVSISRSRRQIRQFYEAEMERVGKFPLQEKPENHYPPTDLGDGVSYKELADLMDKFELSIYQPTRYLLDEFQRQPAFSNFTQADRERFLIGMIKTNFLKRLESSSRSLTLTLKRTVVKIDDMLEKIERYENGLDASDASDVRPDEDEDDEEFFVNQARNPYQLGELDLGRWKRALRRDRRTLDSARRRVAAVTPERDGKLAEIARIIRKRAKFPSEDRDGRSNRKLLVFTTFTDTAEYLYENLKHLADGLGLKIAMVSGSATHTTFGRNEFHEILSNFAPAARNRADVEGEIDLLIATDCISEGQNLQDCDMVLNYDIHWNPVRIIQRFGRVDRIGSRSRSVRMVNFWPTKDMDEYLSLHSRVLARMALADATASGSDDPFSEDDAERQLSFRDEQVRRLQQEVIDLDDLPDSVVMSDFTLDHFLTQLLRYLERNRDALEVTPNGSYAVAPAKLPHRLGAIFFLRQRNAGESDGRQKFASPIHPFYMVYIQCDGTIRYGCASARQALDTFEAAAVGKTEPITELCDQFDSETRNGEDMTVYDKLVGSAIAHIRQAHTGTQISGLGGSKDFKLAPQSQAPTNAEDFELVTWLVLA